MDHQLADFEHRHNIRGRWASTDPCYLEAQKAFFSEKKEQLQASLWAAVVKRHYLLRMKAKYAGNEDNY